MEIIITAGATSEAIDTVRSITNHATGALGCQIAQKLYEKGKARITKLYYICESSAVKPELPCAEVRLVHGTVETADTLRELLTTRPIASVIHSMAVSDYTVCAVSNLDRLADAIEQKQREGDLPAGQTLRSFLHESLCRQASFGRQGKLSSEQEDLLFLLQKTPKIIRMVKKLSPQTQLVGFKLLDHVSHTELIDTAYALLLKNACDFVLANDLQSIHAGRHTGYLVEPDRTVTMADGKAAIADMIADRVLAAVEKGETH